MIDISRGVKAGILAGFVYLFVIQIAVLVSSYYSFLPFALGLLFIPFFGLIPGIIFAGLYDKIPGSESKIKGIIFSVLIWFFFSFFLTGSLFFGYRKSFLNNSSIVSLLAALLFGYFLGFFWDLFPSTTSDSEKKKPMQKTCSNCNRQIPFDAIYCPYCGSFSNKDDKRNE